MNGPRFQILKWDSQWFGFPIGRVDLPEVTASSARNVDTWAREKKLKCVYVLVESTHHTMTLPIEYKEMGIRLEYDLDPHLLAAGPSDDAYFMRRGELESVCSLARQLFNNTRFSQDPRFPPHLVRELYAEWTRRDSVTYSPGCLVVRGENDITGFVTGHTNPTDPTRGTIGLIGVAPSQHNNGIGTSLLDHICRVFCKKGIERVTVVTQESNLAACHLYKTGGDTISKSVWYHRWYD